MSQLNETIRIIMGYLFAFFVVGGTLWFLYQAFLNPDTSSIPAEQSGLIVGGMLTLISSASTFVFSQAVMNSAARSSATATQAGVNAALTQAPQTVTVDAGPPASATITPTTTTTTNVTPPPTVAE